jgi:hypothetical protein
VGSAPRSARRDEEVRSLEQGLHDLDALLLSCGKLPDLARGFTWRPYFSENSLSFASIVRWGNRKGLPS